MNAQPRFSKTFCSQCGKDLGPGDSGVSSCDRHGKRRRVLVDEKCWDLAEHFLSDHPRTRKLTLSEYHMHVQGLAEEFQYAAENYSLPEE